MSDDLVPKADGIKLDKDSGNGAQKYGFGVRPKRSRKRAFWRALKRGEFWAVQLNQLRKLVQDIINNPLPKDSSSWVKTFDGKKE